MKREAAEGMISEARVDIYNDSPGGFEDVEAIIKWHLGALELW